MELELALKITRTRDDLTTEFRVAKDRSGPRFLSKETETKFILTAYLKGFKRERIKIAINKDGTQIAISGEKPIQEMLMVKWIMYKKEPEIRGFHKVFWIPDGVILDRIKGKFNEEDSILTIVMPKKTRGIRGSEIEEVKQEHFDNERSETMAVLADKDPKRDYDDRIGETSSKSPQISREEESSELVPPGTVEVPATTEYREEITRSEELKVEPDGELNQSNALDSLSLEEMLRGELPIVQPTETGEHEIPEDKALEGELHEHDLGPDTTESEQGFHEPQLPLTQQIGNEELPQEEITRVAAKEPEHELKEQDRGSKIKKLIRPPETPDQDQPVAQEIEDHELSRAEEVDEEVPRVRQEEVTDAEVVPQQKDQTEGEPDEEGFVESDKEESSEHALTETVKVPGTTTPEYREEITRPEELKVEPDRELNQSHAPDSLSSEDMLRGELPTLQLEETEKRGISEAKVPETMAVSADKYPKRDDVQEELQPETKEPKPMTRKDDRIGETSSKLPKTLGEEESSELAPIETVEVSTATAPEYREDIIGTEELKVESDGELNQSNTPDSLLSEEMPCGELPMLHPEETEEHETPKAKAPETMVVLANKDPRRDDVQEELQPETEEPKPITREDDYQIRETSSESPKISHEEESSKLASPETIEVPTTTIPEYREEIIRPEELKDEPDGALNQSNAPDSLSSEEMLRGELPTLQSEEIEEPETPEAKAPETMAILEDNDPKTNDVQEELQPKTEAKPKVGSEGELNQSNVPDSLPSKEMLPGKLPTLQPKEIKKPEIPIVKAPKTMAILEKDPKTHDVQEELQPESKAAPRPMTREDDDQTGETSSESPKISHEEESLEVASLETIEVPSAAMLEYKEEITKTKELKDESDGELNQLNVPNSLPSKEMLHGELPTLQTEETKEAEIPEAKAPETMAILEDKDPKTNDVQKKIQPETEAAPRPMTKENDDRIGETSSESSKISHSSEVASPETIEVPSAAMPEYKETITKIEELKVLSDGELNQSKVPDSLPSEEMLRGELPIQDPQKTEKHKILEAKAPRTMAILEDKDPKTNDVQEEIQPETEAAPRPMTREDDDRIGETSSESAKISHEESSSEVGETSSESPKISQEESSSEVASPETIEVPSAAMPKYKEEITKTEELKVQSDGELNQSKVPDSLPSEEMLHGELPIRDPQKTEKQEIPKAKAPETMAILEDKNPKTNNVQEEIQPETEAAPGPMTREDDDRIGEASLESPKISHEESSSEVASPETIEVPSAAMPESKEEITRTKELKVQSDGELNQSNILDSLPSEEMLRGELPIRDPQKTKEHEIPKAKAPETMAILEDKDPKTNDVQEEIQPETEAAPRPMTREDDRIGETSLESSKIPHEESSSEVASPENKEVPSAAMSEYKEKITKTEELKVQSDGELNQSNVPDSLPSEEMLRGELPIRDPQKTEEHKIPKAKAPKTMAILKDKDPKTNDAQEEIQPEKETTPRPMVREDDDRIGETSSESPKILHEEESSEVASPKTIGVPYAAMPEYKEEITRTEELKVESDGELNQSNVPDSLRSEEMLRGELPIRDPQKTEKREIPKAKAPKTMAILKDKDPKTNDVQEEIQPETEATPRPMTREDDDRIGETSSESPKISHEEESSEVTSPETVEVPATTIPKHRGDIIIPEELKVEPDGEINQSSAPDSLSSKEMLRGGLSILQPEVTEEHEIPEAKAPEGEPHEHDLSPVTAEPERGLQESQTPETPPTQKIGNEALPREDITQVVEEPKQEPKEQDQGPEIGKPIRSLEIVYQDQPVAQEIEGHELGKAEEVIDGEVVPQGEDRTKGELDEEGLVESEESNKEESPKVEPKKSISDRSTQTQGEPDEAGLPESKEADKEESPKMELKKSVSDQSTQTEGALDEEGYAESDEEESPKAELKKTYKDQSTQTERWNSRKPSLCPSLFAGSAFLVSLIVLAIQLLRNKKKQKPT